MRTILLACALPLLLPTRGVREALGSPTAFGPREALGTHDAFGLGATDLRYTPRAGTKIARTYTNPGERKLSSMKLSLGGEDHASGGLEITETFDGKLVLSDEIVEVAGGRPTKLRRTFGELSHTTTERTTAGEDESEKTDHQTSDLTDATVVFTWDGEKRNWSAAFDEKGPDEGLLEGLSAEVDLAGCLPGKAVTEGDTWEIEFAAFRAGILQPAGDLALHGEEPRPESETKAEKKLWDAIEGEIQARFMGEREVDGARLGVIAIEAEYWGEVEMDLEEKAHGVQGTTFGFRQKLEGELLWDLEKGLARSFELTGAGTVTMKTRLAFTMGEDEMQGEQEMVFDVGETYTAAFEAEE